MTLSHTLPATPNAVLRQALELIRAGRFAEARSLLERLAERCDERADLLMAYALAGSHEPVAAANLFCVLADRHPQAVHPAYELIEMLAACKRRADAEPVLREVVRRTPHDGRALEALGELLIQLGRLDDAAAWLQKAVALRPDNITARNLMAACLSEQGRLAEADAIFRAILAEYPNDARTLANRGALLSTENAADLALAHYRQAIALNPHDARVRLNHSIALLKDGQYAPGWHEHEWRFRLPGRSAPRAATLMRSLTPDLNLRGKRILVTHEQGLGDTLMYLRYLPPLARRGAQLIISVPETLAGLVRRIPGVHHVICNTQPIPPHDWHCPFISLPRVFAATETPMGDLAPYLTADPNRIRHWRSYLPTNGRLNIGLVWAGAQRPDIAEAQIVDRKRSVRLDTLAPLGRVPGINLVSLQAGPSAREMTDMPEGMRLYDPMDAVRDMHDTAALIASLDAVVSVDTAVVHLAGAIGRPVIMMDRYDNCWRWLSKREDSPWYPTLRIVRQTRPRVWSDVVERVSAILGDMATQVAT